MNIVWDAEKYSENFDFVAQHGSDLLNLLDFEKIKNVLDLGCGNGILTKKLSDMGVGVIGIDASEDQLEIARKQYPKIEFLHSDATDFSLDKNVDAVFSNAVFHWIDEEKQVEMLKCVYDVLNNGGQFVSEFGGYGNAQCVHNALTKSFAENGLICFKKNLLKVLIII